MKTRVEKRKYSKPIILIELLMIFNEFFIYINYSSAKLLKKYLYYTKFIYFQIYYLYHVLTEKIK